MKKTSKASEVYNPVDALDNNIRTIKKGNDWWALAYALEEIEDINKVVKKFKELQKMKVYKERLADSLNNLNETVQKRCIELARKHDKFFDEPNEVQWHKDNQRKLQLLRKEAKRLKL